MNHKPLVDSGKVTLLVFKDNFASRVFQVPFSWMTRMGIVLVSSFFLTIAVSILALRYYNLAKTSDAERVRTLEQENSDLKLSLVKASAKNPVEPSKTPPSPRALPAVPLFSLFPQDTRVALIPPAQLPFSIQNLNIHWDKKSLRVFFALQYTKDDGNSQQGKIILLAKGPRTLLAYPGTVLSSPTVNVSSGETSLNGLILPTHGESFSVSRYREVKAEFPPVALKEELSEINILIFDQEENLILFRKEEVKAP